MCIKFIQKLFSKFKSNDLDLDLEPEDNNLYKRDLLKCMQAIDDYETGMLQISNVHFNNMIRKIGFIIYLGGPAVAKVSSELIAPLVCLYDSDGRYGKDVSVSVLAVLSVMMSQNVEHQQKAQEAELHMALLDDLESLLFGEVDCGFTKSYSTVNSVKRDTIPIKIKSKCPGGRISDSHSGPRSSIQGANSHRTGYFNNTASKGSLMGFLKSDNSASESAATHYKLSPTEETLVFWIIYCLKCMTCSNNSVIKEVVDAVDNRLGLAELLKIASQSVDWTNYINSSVIDVFDFKDHDQAKCLMTILGLGDLTTVAEEEHELEDGKFIENSNLSRVSAYSNKLTNKIQPANLGLTVPSKWMS